MNLIKVSEKQNHYTCVEDMVHGDIGWVYTKYDEKTDFWYPVEPSDYAPKILMMMFDTTDDDPKGKKYLIEIGAKHQQDYFEMGDLNAYEVRLLPKGTKIELEV